MPRPRKPDALTAAQRAARHRAERRAVLLPPDALADLALIRKRYGDASDVAAVTRALREMAARHE